MTGPKQAKGHGDPGQFGNRLPIRGDKQNDADTDEERADGAEQMGKSKMGSEAASRFDVGPNTVALLAAYDARGDPLRDVLI